MLLRAPVAGGSKELFFVAEVGGRVVAQFFDNGLQLLAGAVVGHGFVELVNIAHQHPVLTVHHGHVQVQLGRPLHKLVCGGLVVVAAHQGVDDHVQLFHAALEGKQGCGKVFHGRGRVFGHIADFFQRAVGARAVFGLLRRVVGNDLQAAGRFRHGMDNIAHEVAGARGLLRAVHAKLGGPVHRKHVAAGFVLNGPHGLFHFLGGAHGLFSQFAHLVGHHGKTAPGLAGPCRLNGRVERQQVGLIRHFIDDGHDLADVACLVAQPGHSFLELHNGVLNPFNGGHGSLHLALARGRAGAGVLGAVRESTHLYRSLAGRGGHPLHGLCCFGQVVALHLHPLVHGRNQMRKAAHLFRKFVADRVGLVQHAAPLLGLLLQGFLLCLQRRQPTVQVRIFLLQPHKRGVVFRLAGRGRTQLLQAVQGALCGIAVQGIIADVNKRACVVVEFPALSARLQPQGHVGQSAEGREPNKNQPVAAKIRVKSQGPQNRQHQHLQSNTHNQPALCCAWPRVASADAALACLSADSTLFLRGRAQTTTDAARPQAEREEDIWKQPISAAWPAPCRWCAAATCCGRAPKTCACW